MPSAAACSSRWLQLEDLEADASEDDRAAEIAAAAFALMPLYKRIETHVLTAERIHGDNAEHSTAFTRRGLDYLNELLDQRRSDFMQES